MSSTYQDQWDAIKGAGRGIKTLGGQAVHLQFGQIGKELTGGEGRSGAFRTGYAGMAIASLFTGGEFAEAGNVGEAAEVAEVSSQAAMRARVLTELAQSAGAKADVVAESGGEAATQLEFDFAKGDLSGKLTSFESAAKTVEQGRDALGRFLPKTGGELKPGSLAEKAVWDAIKQKPGWQVIEGSVAVRNAAGDLRLYDGAAISPRGRVIGLEVKSGAGTPTAAQATFDSGVNTFNQAIGVGKTGARLPGPVGRTVLISVP